MNVWANKDYVHHLNKLKMFLGGKLAMFVVGPKRL